MVILPEENLINNSHRYITNKTLNMCPECPCTDHLVGHAPTLPFYEPKGVECLVNTN